MFAERRGITILIGLLVVAWLLSVSCSPNRTELVPDSSGAKSGSRTEEATASVVGADGVPDGVSGSDVEGQEGAEAAGAASAPSNGSATSGTSGSSALSDDAERIARELDAIERELAILQMPSDSDFAGIEELLF